MHVWHHKLIICIFLSLKDIGVVTTNHKFVNIHTHAIHVLYVLLYYIQIVRAMLNKKQTRSPPSGHFCHCYTFILYCVDCICSGEDGLKMYVCIFINIYCVNYIFFALLY